MSCLKCKIKSVKECIECLTQEDIIIEPAEKDKYYEISKKKKKFSKSVKYPYKRRLIKGNSST